MRNANNPAFPVTFEHDDATSEAPGLTKREHFAVMVMQGLLSGKNGDCEVHATSEDWVTDITESSVEFADALLAALEKDNA